MNNIDQFFGIFSHFWLFYRQGIPLKFQNENCWLGWTPQVTFPELVKTMVEADLQEAQRDQLCQIHGFDVHQPEE